MEMFVSRKISEKRMWFIPSSVTKEARSVKLLATAFPDYKPSFSPLVAFV